jgi:hypothetical protein
LKRLSFQLHFPQQKAVCERQRQAIDGSSSSSAPPASIYKQGGGGLAFVVNSHNHFVSVSGN